MSSEVRNTVLLLVYMAIAFYDSCYTNKKLLNNTMNIEQKIVNKIRQLPFAKQQELLNFAEFLQAKEISQPKLKSIKGLCFNSNFDLDFEEFERARKVGNSFG